MKQHPHPPKTSSWTRARKLTAVASMAAVSGLLYAAWPDDGPLSAPVATPVHAPLVTGTLRWPSPREVGPLARVQATLRRDQHGTAPSGQTGAVTALAPTGATTAALPLALSNTPDAAAAGAPPDGTSAVSPALLAVASAMAAPHPPKLSVVAMQAPSDIDAGGLNASATQAPAVVRIPVGTGGTHDGTQGSNSQSGPGEVQAAATTSAVVYTPAQIRQAYGFAALPANTVANKSAYQGSGQVIVIIDAYHQANAGPDLNTFSTKFGLPTCTLLPGSYKAGTAVSALVTSPKAGDGCSFQALYVNAAGAQSATPPATDAGWATEINLDVQWAHAIAPMAKIVLVEASSSAGTALVNAMAFASKLGGQVVTMSYGTSDYAGAPALDTVITGSPTWVASSGDYGSGVSWPASSRNVLSVGGTVLNTLSPRSEVAWSGSGGGRSLYTLMPSWQSSVSIPGNPANNTANASLMRRGVPDVAYNASPYSGMYVYQNGAWFGVGGTSAGSPQWAALVAVVNAARGLSGKAAFAGTGFQQALYGTGAASANYRANFVDVSSGSNGTCASCKATTGYDLVTGLGTPNVLSLLNGLVALK